MFLVALLILAAGLYLSAQLRSVGVTVDFAGSERMRAYRLSTLMHALVHGLDGEAIEGRAQARVLIEEEVRTFEAILLGLRDGSREYGFPAAPTAETVNQVEAVIQQWRAVAKPSLLAALGTSSIEEARKSLADYDNRITELVGSIDKVVKRLAAHSSWQVQYYRRLAYSLLVLLLVVGIGTGYVLHRFVVGPLQELALATGGMGKGDLSQRVRVMPSALMPDEVRELLAAFNEMTEKLETSFRRVRAAERLSRRILASLSDALIVLGRGGEVRYANRVFYDWFGSEPSAVAGRSLHEVLPLAEAARQIEEIAAGSAHANPFEATWRPEEGEERTFRVSVSGLRVAEEEEEEEELVILEELTAYRRMAEKQRTLEAQLLQAEKLSALGGLVSGVAHELNNPLAVVLGRAELLLLGELDERTRRALEAVRTQGDRMKRIIQNLLFVARKHPPERSWVDLNALLRETVELRVHQMHVNNIEVRWHLDEGLPRIIADPHQLGQVFLNLVTNAEHAMAGRPGVLTIGTEPAGETVRVGVADTGPGIAPEHLPRIFEPFFTTKEVGRGTGLGLSVSYGIVVGHGGRIWAASTPGRGAGFFVELPLVTEGAVETAEPLPAPVRPAIGRDILVVDDEAEVRDVLADLLELDGHRVEAVGSGEEALARLRQRRYDVVLSDVRMPGLDGHALCRRLAAEQPELLRRVIFVTGDTVSTETQALLDEMRLPHLAKPVMLESLREAVARVCATQGGSDGT
ncbi:MAG: ATP-binding protein [candidate division NC10 bacterium]